MRGSQHAKSIHEFTIDHQGMRIAEPFANVHNIILGVPRPATTPAFDGKQLAEVIEDWHEEHEWFEQAHKGSGDN